MAAALIIEGLALLAQASPQTIAVAGGGEAALALLQDRDAGLMILHGEGAGFGEELLALLRRQPRARHQLRSAAAWGGAGGESLGPGGSAHRHQQGGG